MRRQGPFATSAPSGAPVLGAPSLAGPQRGAAVAGLRAAPACNVYTPGISSPWTEETVPNQVVRGVSSSARLGGCANSLLEAEDGLVRQRAISSDVGSPDVVVQTAQQHLVLLKSKLRQRSGIGGADSRRPGPTQSLSPTSSLGSASAPVGGVVRVAHEDLARAPPEEVPTWNSSPALNNATSSSGRFGGSGRGSFMPEESRCGSAVACASVGGRAGGPVGGGAVKWEPPEAPSSTRSYPQEPDKPKVVDIRESPQQVVPTSLSGLKPATAVGRVIVASQPPPQGYPSARLGAVMMPASMPATWSPVAVAPAQPPQDQLRRFAAVPQPSLASTYAGVEAAEEAPTGPLLPCPDCGRSFVQESLERHRKICRKVFQQKRKQFNSAAARLGDLDDAQALIDNAARIKKAAAKPKSAPSNGPEKVPKWKMESLAFRHAILAARAAESGNPGDFVKANALKATMEASGGADVAMTRCPHCNRTFNKEAGVRHIAICEKTFGSKPGGGRLIKGGGQGMLFQGGGTQGQPRKSEMGGSSPVGASTPSRPSQQPRKSHGGLPSGTTSYNAQRNR